jgi:hypothetical protein
MPYLLTTMWLLLAKEVDVVLAGRFQEVKQLECGEF